MKETAKDKQIEKLKKAGRKTQIREEGSQTERKVS